MAGRAGIKSLPIPLPRSAFRGRDLWGKGPEWERSRQEALQHLDSLFLPRRLWAPPQVRECASAMNARPSRPSVVSN